MRESTPVTRITAQQSLLNEILSILRWINLWSRDPDSSLGKQNKNSFLKIVSAIRNFMKISHGKPETCVLAQSNGQGHTSITSCNLCFTNKYEQIRCHVVKTMGDVKKGYYYKPCMHHLDVMF